MSGCSQRFEFHSSALSLKLSPPHHTALIDIFNFRTLWLMGHFIGAWSTVLGALQRIFQRHGLHNGASDLPW